MKRRNNFTRRTMAITAILMTILTCSAAAFAQNSTFTYQGRLIDTSTAANGTYDLGFALFDAVSGGTQIGATQTRAAVIVTNGVFTVALDFGAAAFPGANRYLEVSVKKPSDSNFTTLTPRQPITSALYAIRALNASNVDMTGGNSVVNSINNASTDTTINSDRLSADVVRLKPAAAQTSTSTDSSAALLEASGTTLDANNNILGTSRFRLNFNGGFFVSGMQNFGAIPIEGAGTRMLWYPGKSAFRAGTVDSTQFDNSSIGNYSAAFGFNARGSGDYSFSAGERVAAVQSWSLAVGRYNTASGASSVALGEGAHTNARQGSFVFADRSYGGNICDTSAVEPYGIYGSGCTATGNVSTILRAPNNNSFTVRASGGTSFYTNATSTTGLRFSSLNSSNAFYGSLVWTDRSSDNSITPSGQNQTIFRSSGGFTIYTNSAASAGVTVAPGAGSWSSVSDRNMKENFLAVDTRDILRRVLNLPITTWNYKTQDASIRHIGAMAQDFKAAFNVGEDDKRIATIDPDGVAFAAIQGLNEEFIERTTQLKAENAALKEKLDRQQWQIDRLKELVCQTNFLTAVCQAK